MVKRMNFSNQHLFNSIQLQSKTNILGRFFFLLVCKIIILLGFP